MDKKEDGIRSKEEILTAIHSGYSRTAFGLAGDDEKEYWPIRSIYQAMEEYANQFKAGYAAATPELRWELIEFLKWYNGHSERLDITKKSVDDWLSIREKETPVNESKEEYWKQRCEAAEKVMLTKNAPKNEPIKDNTQFVLFRDAYNKWQDIVSKREGYF